ncbi:hypothetical protein H5410_002646 [Solanum commersonii]|uniref:Uncharacterized protein n=1 Tax=Solanum commersonii TaxID=4109 RepID=A0A9J6B2J4_SOLCO|nr:hypothetical protein H5410_002646 [Solanum commersonii]
MEDHKENPEPSSASFCIRDHNEARAIRENLSYCSEHDITNPIIETYSLAMVHIINGDWDVPWNVALEINTIRRLQRSDFQINHFEDIPTKGRKLLNLDKQRTPYIRRKMQEQMDY